MPTWTFLFLFLVVVFFFIVTLGSIIIVDRYLWSRRYTRPSFDDGDFVRQQQWQRQR